MFFFFFQAEDGIRDADVTGVQTCALPISIHTMFRDGGDAPRTPAQVADMQGYGGSDDWIVMPLQCVTQWDSLAHIFYEGKMYNGYDATLVTSSGAAKNSIDKTRDKIAGRGVLLDVARYKGVRALE